VCVLVWILHTSTLLFLHTSLEVVTVYVLDLLLHTYPTLSHLFHALHPTGGATNVVKFFDGYGRFIRSIRIPGESIAAVSWEGGDLRLALAVDSFIYFANIRHSYLWAYFLNTVVFAYPRNDRSRDVSSVSLCRCVVLLCCCVVVLLCCCVVVLLDC